MILAALFGFFVGLAVMGVVVAVREEQWQRRLDRFHDLAYNTAVGIEDIRRTIRLQWESRAKDTPSERCAGCGQPVLPTAVQHDGQDAYIDPSGSFTCEVRYDECGACQDGDEHYHWVEAGT